MPASPPPAQSVLLVGNYPADGQESMLRFAEMLRRGLTDAGISAAVIAPAVVLGRWLPTFSGPGKWLAYLDKYVFFPWRLRARVRRLPADAVVHICDHSNAVYVPAAASAGHRVLVTCHDLGAVRGALGEETDCPASGAGKILQNWIARSIGKADIVACVSSATRRDVERLIRRPDGTPPVSRVVLMGLNVPYHAMPLAEAEARLREIPGFHPSVPYILNVGSSLRRKNREGVLRIFARVRQDWPEVRLIFAGEALPPDLVKLAGGLSLSAGVTQVVAPSNSLLEALYSRAFALLFPSRFEGFGWPAIEAQACGCPVLASNAGSLEEVVGDGGFMRAAADEDAFAGELLRLSREPSAREEWIRRGFENMTRFDAGAMIGKYSALYSALREEAVVKDPAAAAVAPAHRG